ncbi:MAG: ABC transporter permease [Proteobacteria bacterium]|nr:ABC transporter permease [Pseudomonadota bacterium]
MAFTLFIARRYVFSQGRHHFFSFISLLTMVGVSLGTASMIVVLSIINGFETELRDRFLAANAHLLMFDQQGMTNYAKAAKLTSGTLGDEAITGLSPFIHHQTMVKHATGGLSSAIVRGIHPSKRMLVQPYEHLITPRESLDVLEREVLYYDPNSELGVILGVGLARLLDVKVGDEVQFLAPRREVGLLGLYQHYRVVGIYDSGLSHYDDKLAIMSIPGAQILFDMAGKVTGIEIGLVEPWLSFAKENQLHKKFGHDIQIANWQEYNESLFEAIQYERVLIGLLVALVALVSGCNILTTLFVSVFQKERDISLIRSLGSTKKQVMWIFLNQGFYMGVVGSVVGCVLAFILARLLETYQIISLPDVYMLARLPVEYNPKVYLLTSLASIAVATLAGTLPALASIKQDISLSLKSRAN